MWVPVCLYCIRAKCPDLSICSGALMDSITLNLVSIIISVLGTMVPAVWFLSTKIQRLHGMLDAHWARIEEKIANLERQMTDMGTQLAESRRDANDLRERLVVVETRMSAFPQRLQDCGPS